MVEHFWVSLGSVVFGYAALSLDTSCLSEVLLIYRVSVSDLRFTLPSHPGNWFLTVSKREEKGKKESEAP